MKFMHGTRKISLLVYLIKMFHLQKKGKDSSVNRVTEYGLYDKAPRHASLFGYFSATTVALTPGVKRQNLKLSFL
jgi:hypothetical protein